MKTAASPHTSSERGIVAWLRRIFSPGGEPSAGPPRPGKASSPLQRPAANDVVADAAWLEHHPAFAPFAHSLGLPYQPLPVFTEEQSELVAKTSAAVGLAALIDSNELSSLPTAALRLLNLVARDDAELSDLTSAIHQDAALTAAVLRAANSAASGAVSGPIHTIRDAVTRLGVRETGRVAGAVAAKALFSPRSKSRHLPFTAQFADLHWAAVTIAGGAAQFSMERSIGRSDLAYLGGMLHDVGKTMALDALSNMVAVGRAPGELDADMLSSILESHHVELGTQALQRWELPTYLVQLCAAHHQSVVPPGAENAEVHLIRVVSGLFALRQRPQTTDCIDELVQSLSALAITPIQARSLDAGLRARAAQMRQLLAS